MEITATIKRAGNAVASVSRPSNVTTSVTRIGGSGTSDYEELDNKPSINGVELVGDKSTADLLIDVGVTSVNGQTGDVTLNIPTVPTDVSAFNNDAGYVNATQAANAAPVQSVNGSTGAVTVSVPTNVSQLSNDSGFITGINSTDVTTALGYTPYNATNPNGYVNASGAASAAPVQSVNGQTGTVTLSIPTVPSVVSAFTNDAAYVNATEAAAAAPVQSVNGSTGAVTLTIPIVPTDVSAFNNDAGYLTLSTLPVYSGGVSP